MPKAMTSIETGTLMTMNGAPPELMTAAEAKGLDLSALWEAVQQIQTILADNSKTGWQKTWAILQVALTLLPNTGAAPQ